MYFGTVFPLVILFILTPPAVPGMTGKSCRRGTLFQARPGYDMLSICVLVKDKHAMRLFINRGNVFALHGKEYKQEEEPVMAISKPNLTSTALAVVMGISLASVAVTSSAAGKGKGPRESLDVQTTCSLSGSMFNIDVRVTNVSGDTVIPVTMDSYSIKPMYKNRRTKGKSSFEYFEPSDWDGTDVVIVDVEPISHTVNLCEAVGLDENVAGINAMTTVTYVTGEESRTIKNSCSDDPATELVAEPEGFDIDYATLCPK